MINKILVLIFCVLFSQSCFSQDYPLNTSPSDIPNNAYIKDMNGDLDKYIGLWMGTWSGKTVYLELKKIKTYLIISGDTHPYYKDRIYGERKIINQNGNVEIDGITNFDNENPEFSGISINPANPTQKRISFYPKNMCGFRSQLNITSITATTMTLQMVDRGGTKTPNCIHDTYIQQYGEYPLNFPKNIVLTKQ